LPAVLLFTATYVGATWLYGRWVGSELADIYGPVTVVLAVLIGLIHRPAKFPLPVLWALSLVGLGNMAGGVWLVAGRPLYLAPVVGSLRYDKLFHTFATGVAAWAAYEALRRWGSVERFTGGVAFATVLVACGAGALVEIVEFSSTIVFPTTNVGDYGNNMLDLVANLVGAVVTAVLLAWRSRRRFAADGLAMVKT